MSTDHKALGVDYFNGTWDLLEKQDRSRADDDRMLHMAHASRFHWGEVGEPINFARGEWQVSRVYAVLGRSEPAVFHGRRSLEICQANGIGDFDLAFAYEALARGYRVGGDKAEAARYLDLAREAVAGIKDPEDRDWTVKNLDEIAL